MAYYAAETYKVGSSIGYLVRRAANLMLSRVEASFAEHELTFVQWLVLMYLRDGLAHTSSEICRQLCHDSGALTRVVDQLSARGLIERHRSMGDRRVVQLSLTDTGLRTVEALIPLVVSCLNRALANFTKDEADSLTALLAKLVTGVELPTDVTSLGGCAATEPQP